MDPLSDVLSLLKPRSYTFGAFDVGGSLAVQFPSYEGLKCYAIVSGERWLVVEGMPEPMKFQAGDVFVLTQGRPFRLANDLSAPPVDLAAIHALRLRNGGTVTVNGGGALAVGGHFLLDGSGASALLALFPPVIHLRTDASRESFRWALRLMMEELSHPQPGGLLIAQNLAMMMLVQALRLCVDDPQSGRQGWLAALSDPALSRAITALHGDPSRRWTLQDLAETAALSRSAFAERFKTTVGESAMDYLTRWRMLLAADRLVRREPVGEIGPALGYESESAFSAAFKRVMGLPPRQYARQEQPVRQAVTP